MMSSRLWLGQAQECNKCVVEVRTDGKSVENVCEIVAGDLAGRQGDRRILIKGEC
jgi:hypothetical protein